MASASSSKDPKDLHALKLKAVKYYEQNGVPAKMEEVLNSMFYEEPPDVYGHLVNFFGEFTLPATLSKVTAMQIADCNGHPTMQTDVYCTVNNKEKLVVSSSIPSTNVTVRPEEREKAELELRDSVAESVQIINTEFLNKLSGIDPRNQEEIDTLVLEVIEKKREEYLAKKAAEEENQDEAAPPPPPVEEKDKKKSAKGEKDKKEEKKEDKAGKTSAPLNVIPEKPAEFFVRGSEAVAAISQGVCACAAQTHNVPVYRHVASLARSKGALHEFRIPLPMVTIIQSGKHALGKVNCVKEFMLVPGVDMPVDKSIEHIHHIYNHVAKSFASKLGVSARYVNETGALCPQLDVPTQALDILQEAVNAQGLTIGEDMHLALNAAGHEFFDYEKGKYETVAGTLKNPEDMVDFWADILSKYPSIVAIIDPVRSQDKEVWLKLCERVSDSVFIVGENFYNRPGLLRKEELPNPAHSSGIVMNFERVTSVSDIIACSNKMQELNNEVIISTNVGETTDTFIVDLAVGVNARFLKIGGPCRGERSCKLNRLHQIFQELEAPLPVEITDSEDMKPEALPEDKQDEEERENVGEGEDKPEDEKKEDDEEPKVDEEKEEKKPEEGDGRWGEGEKSRLKLHTPFMFPFIQMPPPPEVPDEEGQAEKPSSPASRKSK